jgi:hypothetical protein
VNCTRIYRARVLPAEPCHQCARPTPWKCHECGTSVCASCEVSMYAMCQSCREKYKGTIPDLGKRADAFIRNELDCLYLPLG